MPHALTPHLSFDVCDVCDALCTPSRHDTPSLFRQDAVVNTVSTASDYVSETAKLEMETVALETAAVPPPCHPICPHTS